jgi:DHA1 family tetracycline resistance protein-like MFS transporter
MDEFKRRHALTIIVSAVLIDSIGFGVVIPVIPRLVVELTGDSMSRATSLGGWLLVVYAVTQFLCGPIMGNLSDRFGRRPVLLASMLAFGLDYVFMALAPNFGWLFLGRAIAGIAGAIYAPATAAIADITPADKRAQNFGLTGAAFGMGFIIGPALGGLIGALGTRAPFLLAAILALINAAVGAYLLPETLKLELRRKFSLSRANPFSAFRALARQNGLVLLLAAWFCWVLAHQVYPSTWSFFAKLRLNWNEAEIGYSLTYVGVMMALIQVVGTGRIVKRLGETQAALLGMAVATASFVFNAFAISSWMLYASLTIGSLQALVFPAMNAILSKRVSADRQGELQGGLASLQSVAAITGYLVLPQMLAFFTSASAPIQFPGAAFLLAAGITLAAGTLLAAFIARPTTLADEVPSIMGHG